MTKRWTLAACVSLVTGGVAGAVLHHLGWLGVAVAGAAGTLAVCRAMRRQPIQVQARRRQLAAASTRLLTIIQSRRASEEIDARAEQLLEAGATHWINIDGILRDPLWSTGGDTGEHGELRARAKEAADALMEDLLLVSSRTISRTKRRFRVPLLSPGYRSPHFSEVEAGTQRRVDGLAALGKSLDAVLSGTVNSRSPRISFDDLERTLEEIDATAVAQEEIRDL
ncbi:MAG: hypothetical protein EXR76_15740 [Myxococcales bacterium]|nr:hypothetical protein [Myxococcales bacterium]